jgi:hypothetical protein
MFLRASFAGLFPGFMIPPGACSFLADRFLADRPWRLTPGSEGYRPPGMSLLRIAYRRNR